MAGFQLLSQGMGYMPAIRHLWPELDIVEAMMFLVSTHRTRDEHNSRGGGFPDMKLVGKTRYPLMNLVKLPDIYVWLEKGKHRRGDHLDYLDFSNCRILENLITEENFIMHPHRPTKLSSGEYRGFLTTRDFRHTYDSLYMVALGIWVAGLVSRCLPPLVGVIIESPMSDLTDIIRVILTVVRGLLFLPPPASLMPDGDRFVGIVLSESTTSKNIFEVFHNRHELSPKRLEQLE